MHLSVKMAHNNESSSSTSVAFENTSFSPPQDNQDLGSQPLFSESDITALQETTVATLTTRTCNEDGVPVYRMDRSVKTVVKLWEEWKEGLEGNWPVEYLEREYKAKWRKGDNKWFNIRKRVIEAVEDLQQDVGLSAEEAIERLQNVMNQRNWSLDGIGTALQSRKYYPSLETKRRKLNNAE